MDFQGAEPWILGMVGHQMLSRVRFGAVTGKGVNSRVPRPTLRGLRNPVDHREPAESRYGLVDLGGDLVLILMKLTTDVERFDSMVAHQRELLQQGDAYDNDRLDVQWERLRFEAAELVSCARQALERLERLSELASPPPHGA
jgi:hypothetical protein